MGKEETARRLQSLLKEVEGMVGGLPSDLTNRNRRKFEGLRDRLFQIQNELVLLQKELGSLSRAYGHLGVVLDDPLRDAFVLAGNLAQVRIPRRRGSRFNTFVSETLYDLKKELMYLVSKLEDAVVSLEAET